MKINKKKKNTNRNEEASNFRQCQCDASVSFGWRCVRCYFNVKIIVEMSVTRLV